MNIALRRSMTREEFLAWAESQEGRYEFDGLAPVAMTGGTAGHGIISRNLNGQLYQLLQDSPCQSMTAEGSGVATIGDIVRYPDATVTCSPIDTKMRLTPEPVVVFEVLSPSSMHVDLVEKMIEYKAVSSIRRYVIIEQDKVEVRGYVRQTDGKWTETPPLRAGDALDLPEIGIAIPLAAIYRGASSGER